MSIEFEVFDPKYWMFNLGISLNRYEETDQIHQWIRKELVLGFLFFNINISININETEVES